MKFETMEEEVPVKVEEPVKTGGVPVPHEVLQNFLNASGYPKKIKIQIVDTVQKNNRKGIYNYTIDYVPGNLIRVENGKMVI